MEKTLVPKAEKGKKNWIKGAVNPDHVGYCTPMTKETCTPKRKAFALTMKKHHGFHKKDGGEIKTSVRKGSMTLTENGKTGTFTGNRTVLKQKGLPNDTTYRYSGITPDKTEIFNYSTSGKTNQLNYNGKLSKVSPDSVKMYRERVNNIARILPRYQWQ